MFIELPRSVPDSSFPLGPGPGKQKVLSSTLCMCAGFGADRTIRTTTFWRTLDKYM